MKNVNVTLTDEEHATLDDVKGDRTWREALLQEFDADV